VYPESLIAMTAVESQGSEVRNYSTRVSLQGIRDSEETCKKDLSLI
jgi:hypothetical protein